jgi:hypothetical protein
MKNISFDDCKEIVKKYQRYHEIGVDFDSIEFIKIETDKPKLFKARLDTILTLTRLDTLSEIETFYSILKDV